MGGKTNLDPNKNNDVWRIVAALKNSKATNNTPLQGPEGLLYSNEEAQFTDHPPLPKQEQEDQLMKEFVDEFLEEADEETITPATPELIKGIITGLRNKVSPGEDNTSNLALKHLPPVMIHNLTALINGALSKCHFPDVWKKAQVIMIPKSAKGMQLSENYRPISLLSTLAKLIEKVIKIRLEEESLDKNLLPDEQFGFRAQLSTELQVVRIAEIITHGFDFRQRTGLVLLDLSKAFDKVWHVGLLVKMINMEISPPMVKIIASYLKNRSFSTKFNGAASQVHPIRAGVPQGSVLGPTLFNLFMTDLPRTPVVQMALYADDTALIYKSSNMQMIQNKLQKALNKMKAWADRYRIRINPNKTQAILFKKGGTLPGELMYENQAIPWTKTAKYLGVHLDDKLTWGKDIEKIITKPKVSATL
ncbi:unnamed protein product [Brassicogethes aeneus]|uniref:Reverse transcriptase domain-containing protein n=1 Tax=Brassicogethes aeneus TaxID=1431903 RepID=A0A9P0AXU0_BRAAE|nr:unnamed protein product [Brassicogethes aeneus]